MDFLFKIIGVELNSQWNAPKNNCEAIEVLLEGKSADLILLPEMFNTGFNMNAHEIAESPGGFTLGWMKTLAKEKNAAIGGSIAICENNHYYNRFYWVEPDGKTQHYNKIHLFSYTNEDKIFTAGKEKTIIHYKGWRFALQICYDLRFPEKIRNQENYDAIIYLANWPKTRIKAWKTLLAARAIENQAYCIGVNRSGVDENQWEYETSSRIVFPDGESLAEAKNSVLEYSLSLEKLKNFKEKYPFLKDRS